MSGQDAKHADGSGNEAPPPRTQRSQMTCFFYCLCTLPLVLLLVLRVIAGHSPGVFSAILVMEVILSFVLPLAGLILLQIPPEGRWSKPALSFAIFIAALP